MPSLCIIGKFVDRLSEYLSFSPRVGLGLVKGEGMKGRGRGRRGRSRRIIKQRSKERTESGAGDLKID